MTEKLLTLLEVLSLCSSSPKLNLSSLWPLRSNAKCKNDRHKQEGSHTAHSPPPSPSADQPITWQNGNHSVRVRNGKDSGTNHTEANKANDVCSLLYFTSICFRPFRQIIPHTHTHTSSTWFSHICVSWLYISLFPLWLHFVSFSVLKPFQCLLGRVFVLSRQMSITVIMSCFISRMSHVDFFSSRKRMNGNVEGRQDLFEN